MAPPDSLPVGLVQTNAGPDIAANLDTVLPMIQRAADQGAKLIALPECAVLIVHGRDKALALVPAEAEHPALPAFADAARRAGAWLLAGSVQVRTQHGTLANRSYLFAPDGAVAARYDKIHMFDVDLPGGETYRESETYTPGSQAVLARTPWGPVGLSICYDLRFAGLYRALAQAGAGILTVPAAFTQKTGEAHWHVLLRARAIETGCFVIAPAQTGRHDGDRRTFGHSLVVDPWGAVIADAGTEVGVVTARLDLTAIGRARSAVPALRHDRHFTLPPAQRSAAE